jgi:hypothetical protein
MKAMALDRLKMLGLAEHEVVIACRSDKEHYHVHRRDYRASLHPHDDPAKN